MNIKTPNLPNLPNLNVARFLLALVVVLFHIPISSENLNLPFYDNLPILKKGSLAVYYFFTLSGFLIVRNLYIEKQNTHSIDLKSFYLKRALRIWPVYFIVLIIGLVAYHVIMPLFNINKIYDYNILELLGYYLFFIPNIFNKTHQVGGILNITWSIGVEEQFYIFIPIIIYSLRNTLSILKILLSTLILIFIIVPDIFVYGNYYFYFISGGILSIIGYKRNKTGSKLLLFSCLLVFILIFFTNLIDIEDTVFFHLFHLIFSSLFFYSIAYITNEELIPVRLINYFGKISYGIYMYHMIVLFVVLIIFSKIKYIFPTNDIIILLINIITIVFTIFTAHLSHKYMEKRLFNYFQKHLKF